MPSVARPDLLKVLVVPNVGMGDALISLSVLNKIKTLYPNSELSVICWGKRWLDVFRETTFLNRLLVVDPPFEEGKVPPELRPAIAKILESIVKEHEYAVSVCGVECIENVIKACLPPDKYYLWNLRQEPAPSYYESISTGVNRHFGAWLNWHQAIAPTPLPEIPELLRNWMNTNVKGKKLAVITVAAGSQIRRMPLSIFLKTYIHLLHAGFYPVALVPSDSTRDYYMKFFEKNKIKALEFGALTEVFEFISLAGLYVGPDTGFSHFAALKGIPTVVIMGPSLTYFRPFGARVTAINYGESCEFQKRPCDAYGRCEYTDNGAKCLQAFNTTDLEAALTKIKLIEGF